MNLLKIYNLDRDLIIDKINKYLILPEDRINDCWKWNGSKTAAGYPKIGTYHWATISIHRLIFLLSNGFINDKLWILHKCDNPECCNPNHLVQGTPKDNVNDCKNKGRLKIVRGSKNGRSKLKESDILKIRGLHNYINQREIADQFNIDPSWVSRIVNNKFWRHLR